MKRLNLMRLASSGLIALAAILGVQQPTQAIVINNTAGAATAANLGMGSPAVVQISIGGSLCSGSLISANTVITAQHCTSGANNLAAYTVNFDTDGNGVANNASIGVSNKFELPGFSLANFLAGKDITILQLSSNAPASITPLQLFAGNPTGVIADTIGYGNKGVNSIGLLPANTTKWGAENVIDFYGAAQGAGGVTANIFNTDFDNGTAAANTLSGVGSSPTPLANEGTTAGGDSGGPLIVNMFGMDLIVGVLSGGTTANSIPGDISWWTGTFVAQSFIQEHGGVFASQAPLPVPSTLALMILGILCVGVARRWGPRRTS